jgi:hypothetical protein
MNHQKAKIQELRSAEIHAETRGDIDLLIQLKEERLLLELDLVRHAKNHDKKEVIFKPQHHSKIKQVSMEKVGLDYIPFIKGAYNVLAVRCGSGKSAVALKSMLLWLKCNPTKKSLAFFTEDGIEEIKTRVEIICNNSRLDIKLLDRIEFVCLDNDDRIKWIESSRNGYKIREDYIASVIEHCLDNKIEFIILDPLKRFHRLNENSNDDMDVLVRDIFTKIAVDAKAVVLVLHHGTKGEQGGARGASTITDSARIAWQVGRYFIKDKEGKVTENLEKRGKIKLEILKDNMGIEKLCKIRDFEDRSIPNPLVSGGFNASPIETVFESEPYMPDIF